MRTLYPINEIPKNCPELFINTAKRNNLKIYEIIHNEEEGINKEHHCYNYTQYSVRPYKLTYGCDGTTDNNIHLIALHICNYYNINYIEVYKNAYNDRDLDDHQDFEKYLKYIQNDKFLKTTTIFPSVINETIVNELIHDLYEIN